MIIGSKLFFYKNLPSTNTLTIALLRNSELPEGSIIYTNYQSSGRGQAGNTWESEKDKNLLISVVLYPSMLDPSSQFLVSMAVSLGICDFLKRHVAGVTIKWPNDIYVKDDKIAGILIENSLMGNLIEYSVAGIGININQTRFLSDAPNPVSLAMLTGKQYDTTECLHHLASDLDRRYKQLLAEEYVTVKSDYLKQLYRFEKWSDYKDLDGSLTGRIVDVGDDGKLIMEREDGTLREYSFREIDFI